VCGTLGGGAPPPPPPPPPLRTTGVSSAFPLSLSSRPRFCLSSPAPPFRCDRLPGRLSPSERSICFVLLYNEDAEQALPNTVRRQTVKLMTWSLMPIPDILKNHRERRLTMKRLPKKSFFFLTCLLEEDVFVVTSL